MNIVCNRMSVEIFRIIHNPASIFGKKKTPLVQRCSTLGSAGQPSAQVFISGHATSEEVVAVAVGSQYNNLDRGTARGDSRGPKKDSQNEIVECTLLSAG